MWELGQRSQMWVKRALQGQDPHISSPMARQSSALLLGKPDYLCTGSYVTSTLPQHPT